MKEKECINVTIKEIRKDMGLSQKDFSDRFGLSVRTLQNWEQGRREVPVYVLKMIEEIYLREKECLEP